MMAEKFSYQAQQNGETKQIKKQEKSPSYTLELPDLQCAKNSHDRTSFLSISFDKRK